MTRFHAVSFASRLSRLPLPFFASPYLPISLFRSTHLERVTLTPHVDPTNFVVETAEKKIRKSQSMKKKILKQMIILHE